MNIKKTIGYIFLGLGIVTLLAFTVVNSLPLFVNGASADNVTSYTVAATSTATQVGPQVNVQVSASSSLRNYLYLANNGGPDIYCRGDNDKPAALNQGIKLASSTNSIYEFTLDKGNLYIGAVRCTSSASTTILTTEYRRP